MTKRQSTLIVSGIVTVIFAQFTGAALQAQTHRNTHAKAHPAHKSRTAPNSRPALRVRWDAKRNNVKQYMVTHDHGMRMKAVLVKPDTVRSGGIRNIYDPVPIMRHVSR